LLASEAVKAACDRVKGFMQQQITMGEVAEIVERMAQKG
jgi:hypothetical protein